MPDVFVSLGGAVGRRAHECLKGSGLGRRITCSGWFRCERDGFTRNQPFHFLPTPQPTPKTTQQHQASGLAVAGRAAGPGLWLSLIHI